MSWAETTTRNWQSEYEEYTSTNLYVERPFSANVTSITLTNDSDTQNVQYSFDGATLEGELKSGESITIKVKPRESIYIKSDTDAVVRYWGE